jgi:K+-sensing histidine kinase KdpD
LISGFRAGLFCIVLSAAAANFFLIAPRFSFYIEHPGEVFAILLFVLASLMNAATMSMRSVVVLEPEAIAAMSEALEAALKSLKVPASLTWCAK